MSKFRVVTQLADNTHVKIFNYYADASAHMEWVIYNLDPISCHIFYHKRPMTGE